MVELDFSDAHDLDCEFWTEVTGHEGLPYIHIIEDAHGARVQTIRIDLSSSLLKTNTTLALTYYMRSEWGQAPVPYQEMQFEILLFQPRVKECTPDLALTEGILETQEYVYT